MIRDLLDREWRAGETRVIPKLDLFNPRGRRSSSSTCSQRWPPGRWPGILIQDDLVLQRFEGFSNWGKA